MLHPRSNSFKNTYKIQHPTPNIPSLTALFPTCQQDGHGRSDGEGWAGMQARWHAGVKDYRIARLLVSYQLKPET